VLAQYRIPWKINNYGWNSDIDYYKNEKVNSLALKVQCFLESSGMKSATK